jgi:hypothetical protein
MRITKKFLIVSAAFTLSACVVPVMDKIEATPSTCKTTTQSMSLKMANENVFVRVNCNDQACFAAALAVFAGSAIISGSIVLTNNTVHWLEYQGTCDDSFLNTTKQRFLDSFNKSKPIPESLPISGT